MRLRPAACVLFALFAPGTANASQDKDWLDEQKSKLAQSPEEPVYEGARACASRGGAAAVELLLETLGEQSDRGLPAPHYRDIAWDSLVEVKDAEGRAVVAEYLDDSKLGMVREWCADLLGLYGDEAFGDALVDALKDRESGVPRAAARALGRLAYAPAVEPLQKLVKSKDPRTRANAIVSLAQIDAATYAPQLAQKLGDEDPGARCCLLSMVPELLDERTEELSTGALGDEDWRPRLQAIRNLGGVQTKTAIDALIRATRDDRASLGLEAIQKLAAHTGMKFGKPELWERWWADNRESFVFGKLGDAVATDDGGSVATYNGIRIDSNAVAFVINVSSWMTEELKQRGLRRIDVARDELDSAFAALQPPFLFNVFLYAE